jgi:hypothetical protein
MAKAGGDVEGRHSALVHFVDVAASAANLLLQLVIEWEHTIYLPSTHSKTTAKSPNR